MLTTEERTVICHAEDVKRMSKAHVKRREEERRVVIYPHTYVCIEVLTLLAFLVQQYEY
jgi:hypothetical protein